MSDKPTPYAISLVLHRGVNPGWRVHTAPVSAPEGVPVSIKEAEAFARTAGDIAGYGEETPTPFEVVRDGTTEYRAEVEAQLSEAETRAATIPALRRALKDFES
jgi:hypothetical protein